MNLQELYGLMQKFEASSLTTLELEYEGGKVKLSRAGVAAAPVAVQPQTAVAPAAPLPVTKESPASVGNAVTAPLVGVFYTAPTPGAKPFVQPGSKVKKGDTLCLIEAMKVMNEVPAPADGVIRQILACNEQLVEYGAPLFELEEQDV